MTLLRRRRLLEPVQITTSPAPQLGEGHVDVVSDRQAIAPGVYRSTPSGLVAVDPPARPCQSSRDLDDEPAPLAEGEQVGHVPPGGSRHPVRSPRGTSCGTACGSA